MKWNVYAAATDVECATALQTKKSEQMNCMLTPTQKNAVIHYLFWNNNNNMERHYF